MAQIDPITGLPKSQAKQFRYGGPFNPDDPNDPRNPFTPSTPSAPMNAPSPLGLGATAKKFTIPGWSPDFRNLIETDPNYVQAKSELGAQSIGDRAGLAAARQRALINFGIVPDFQNANTLGFVGQDIQQDLTPETLQAAKQNKFSVQSQIDKGYQNNVRALRRALAARGGLQSGEFGYGLQQTTDARDQMQYEAANELLEALAGYEYGWKKAQAERQRQEQAAREEAARFQSSLPQNQPVGEQTVDATIDPATGLYRGPDGRYYDENGQPVSDAQVLARKQQNQPVRPRGNDLITTKGDWNPQTGGLVPLPQIQPGPVPSSIEELLFGMGGRR